MKKFTFSGGIHPEDFKAGTSALPIKVLPSPEIMVFPMAQHIGAPAAAIVKKGDRVLKYQMIGKAAKGVSANIFSSVSGEVLDISEKMISSGLKCVCVTVKNDFLEQEAEIKVPPKDKSIADIAFDAGIVGMGGAAFPTHIKLTLPEGKKAENVIINGSECEPYITSDHRVMLERGETVLNGLKTVIQKLGAKKGFIAIEKNKPDAIENMKKICSGEENIKVIPLETKYPQGSEKQLISAVLKREVPSGKLPSDVGAVVLNVDTVSELYKAAVFGTPLISRIVTVAGPAVKNPANFEVRLGTSVNALLDAAGLTVECAKVIMGGPMMGTALFGTDVPVIKGCGSVLAFGEEDIKHEKSMACIRCGRCTDACPMGLMPLNICNLAEIGNYGGCEKYHVYDCMECGSCAYVCPSKRQLVQYIRLAKQKLRAKGIGGKK